MGRNDAMAFFPTAVVVVDGTRSNLADNAFYLRSGHSMSHANVVEHVFDAIGGHGRDVEVATRRVRGARGFDDVLSKTSGKFLRVAVVGTVWICIRRMRGGCWV